MTILGIRITNKIKTYIKGSVAQLALLIIIIILPVTMLIFSVIMPDIALDFIENTLDEIPIINVFTKYYTSSPNAKELTSFAVFPFLLKTVVDTATTTYIIGLFVHIFEKLGDLAGIRGIPAVQTLLGVLFSSFCLKWINRDETKTIFCSIILVLFAFGASVLVDGFKFLLIFIELGVDLLLSVFTAAAISTYCTVLILILKGWFSDFWTAANVFIWALIPSLVFLLVDYLVSLLKRNYN